MVGPFIFFDHFGPAEFRAGNGLDVRPHPHIGLATVTYLFDGEIMHRDSLGTAAPIKPGEVNWMTAGRGIVHSEMPEQEEGLMRGFQLWVNLPASDKMSAPRYQDIAPQAIPEVKPAAGVKVRVVAGHFGDTIGPVDGIVTQPLYLDIALEPGTSIEVLVPPDHNAFAYVFEGAGVAVGGEQLGRSELAVLADGDSVALAAGEDAARVLLVAGKPLGEPVARYGPFVMNTRQEIIQAVEDFNAGRF
jgi:hypothetical protein